MAKDILWGKRLSQILREKKVSQKKAADIAQIAPSVLSGWLTGTSPTDHAAVKRICDELGVSFTWILTGERENSAQEITTAELYDEVEFFNGIARIRIDRLIKRK